MPTSFKEEKERKNKKNHAVYTSFRLASLHFIIGTLLAPASAMIVSLSLEAPPLLPPPLLPSALLLLLPPLSPPGSHLRSLTLPPRAAMAVGVPSSSRRRMACTSDKQERAS